ncbi:MAG: tetratricopeptide (TPR) repeat protein [Myxococcota bacterium]|jgi:tetratricopeptide (TPR) repeat protein
MKLALGPFQLIRPVARGGMAEVWRARHQVQGIPVAIKVMTDKYAVDPDYVRRFRDEVRAVAALDHPGVVMVLDHGVIPAEVAAQSSERLIEGAPWLAMEYASGGTLASLGAMPWPRLRTLLMALLEALAHAHARGVIHRDLKPANVLLATRADPRPGLKLSDFGIAWARLGQVDGAARQPTAAPEEHVIVGTPTYMAPEQIRGDWRDYGPWTDLYALGCLAWALCAGRSPFSRGRISDTLVAQLRDPPPEFSSRAPVPDGFEDWLRRLLHKDFGERFACAADAARDLERLGAVVAKAPATLVPTIDVESTLEATHSSLVEDWRGETTAPAGARGVPDVRAHVPRTWRRREPAPPPVRLVGAGLSLYGLRTLPLVGRDPERDRLWSALRDVGATGRARLVLIRGAAGTGKSTLAEWVCRRAHELGSASWVQVQCRPGLEPSEAIRRMGEAHFGLAGLDRAEIKTRVRNHVGVDAAPDLVAVLAEILAPPDLPDMPQVSRIRLTQPSEYYTATRRGCQVFARKRPLVAWLDDVQWGLHSIGLAGQILQSQVDEPSPILLVLTLRDEALSAESREADWLRQLLRHPSAETIRLGPLSPVARTELLSSLMGLKGPLAARVAERTGGNPLFTVQLVGNWVRQGFVVAQPGGFGLREGASAELPDDLHAVWAERIESLVQTFPASARQHLEVAAVLGVEVLWGEWKRACDDPEGYFGDRFPGDDPLRSQLIEHLLATRLAVGTRDAWSFVHGMLRESLERLAREAGRLEQHHRACATMLRDRAAEPAIAERVGRHLLAAGEPKQAAPHLLTAARSRMSTAGADAALVLLERAIGALDAAGVPSTDRLRARAGVLEAVVALSRAAPDDALQAAERAVAGARAAIDADVELAQALRVRADAHIAARRTDAAIADLEAIGPIAAAAARPDLEAEAQLGRAELALSAGELDAAIGALDRGLAVLRGATGTDIRAAVAEFTLLRGRCMLRQGALRDAIAALEQARSQFSTLGFGAREADALDYLGQATARTGELGTALRHLERAASRYTALGSRRALGCRMRIGLVHIERGRPHEAAGALEAARSAIARLGRRGRAEATAALGMAQAALAGTTESFDESAAELRDTRPSRSAATLVSWLLRLTVAAGAQTLDEKRVAVARELTRRPQRA